LTGTHANQRRKIRINECLRTEIVYNIPLVLKKCPIVPSACDILWAPQVDIDRITMSFDDFGRLEEVIDVIGAELDDQRPIQRSAFLAIGYIEVLFPVAFPRLLRSKHLYIHG
jgi:hypothetical protein